MTPTLHVLALPHTQTVRNGYECCAYTQKVVKFCQMMSPTHRIVLYAGEVNEAPCSEHVVCITEEERAQDFGTEFDTVDTPLEWDARRRYWRRFAQRAVPAIGERAGERDLLLLTTSTQTPIADAHPALLACEWAVGYEGFRLPFCVFESHTWRAHAYGLADVRDGRAFDAVIPNFFDRADFTPRVTGEGGDLLFMGRLIQRKGPHVAAAIAKRVGSKLYVAGPGAASWEAGKIVCSDGTVLEAPGLEYVGILNRAERAERLADASALLVPTLYIEPFGGVAVEAMMSGTPVVASDWGAFTETVQTGITGYRFSTLAEGAAAVRKAQRLHRGTVASVAASQWSLEAIQPKFAAYFDRLLTLWGEGWYA